MQVAGDVKCYHCGHISGQVEGERAGPGEPLALHTFRPREGYRGQVPQPGARLRCERCSGPVFVEDLRPVTNPLPIPMRPARKKTGTSRTKAA